MVYIFTSFLYSNITGCISLNKHRIVLGKFREVMIWKSVEVENNDKEDC
jgi:hypothetical protein